jgi:2-polyprenyl-6-methoxyphenol hydroxylase-like FAD-dependent oxidoreductase
MATTADVLVVGAGPTGLTAATELAARGVSVRVLERRFGESNLTRAFAVHARTLEFLDSRGMSDELVDRGTTVSALRVFGRLRVDLSGLPSRFPYVLVVPQYETERVLAKRADALGVEVAHGREVVGLRQNGDGVELDVRTPDGGDERWAASYVVGADGVRSAVRDLVGLPFPGRSVVRSVMLADVRLTEAPADVLTVGAVGDGFAFVAPFGDGWFRVIAWDRDRQLPDDAPVRLDEVREVARRALGTDFGMHEARFLSRFHSDERQAPRYRIGRVLLAGDAAHVHSPAGGQGMNVGMLDAANLGWKLAAEVRGEAVPGVLDTYHAERYPVGRAVVRFSGGLLRMALLSARPLRALRMGVARLALSIPAVEGRAARTVSGLATSYPAPPGSPPLTGRRAPDLPLSKGRLYEALRGGRFVLVRPPGVEELAGGPHVDQVTGDGPGLLVRPDGYVAWSGTDGITALRRWYRT